MRPQVSQSGVHSCWWGEPRSRKVFLSLALRCLGPSCLSGPQGSGATKRQQCLLPSTWGTQPQGPLLLPAVAGSSWWAFHSSLWCSESQAESHSIFTPNFTSLACASSRPVGRSSPALDFWQSTQGTGGHLAVDTRVVLCSVSAVEEVHGLWAAGAGLPSGKGNNDLLTAVLLWLVCFTTLGLLLPGLGVGEWSRAQSPRTCVSKTRPMAATGWSRSHPPCCVQFPHSHV
jgi:hypothetical protein